MASGLRGVAKALGRPPEAVPADPGWLQPRLGRVAPASLNLSAKSWSNTVSNARAAMAHFGCVRRRHHRKTDLSPAWRVLWEAVLASGDKTLRPALGRFVYFLNDVGVAPEAVTDVHAAAYHQALIADEIRKSPDKVFKNALHALEHGRRGRSTAGRSSGSPCRPRSSASACRWRASRPASATISSGSAPGCCIPICSIPRRSSGR